MAHLWLLRKIIQGADLEEAPKSITFYSKHYSYLIEIDKDHTAELIIDEDSLKVLKGYNKEYSKIAEK